MTKKHRIPDYRKMYPEASEEIIAVLKVTERKMQYQEYDLKVERTIVDKEKGTVTVLPSREDSYERLTEQGVQFAEHTESAEEQAIKSLEILKMYRALSMLSAQECEIVKQLYFLGKTERELAQSLGISQNAVNKKRKQILKKLKEEIDAF